MATSLSIPGRPPRAIGFDEGVAACSGNLAMFAAIRLASFILGKT
jgi:hypothetical protein